MTIGYRKKSAAILFLALVVMGLMTSTLTLPWFYSASTFTEKSAVVPESTLNSTFVTYDLFGIRSLILSPDVMASRRHICTRLQNKVPAQVDSYESLLSSSSTNVSYVFRLSQASVITACLTSIALCAYSLLFTEESIRNKIIFKLGLAFMQTMPRVLSLILVVSVFASFLALLGLGAAFKKDRAGCDRGACLSLSGSSTSQDTAGAVMSAIAWGPQAGWFVALVAAPICLLVAYLVVTNRLPSTNHFDHSAGEHDLQPILEQSTGTENMADIPPSCKPLDGRERIVLAIAAAGSALAAAVIVWACVRPQCTNCTANTSQLGDVYGLEGIAESIEMQVQPLAPAAWPSLEEGRKFYEQALSSLAARGTGLGFEFDAKARSERSVVRHIWQTSQSCVSSNCSMHAHKSGAMVRYRQVVLGSGNGSSDFTLKQTRQFRESAAALPQCTITAESAGCKAKIEANYFWRGNETSDVAMTWQRSCTLQLHPSSPVDTPAIRSVRDVLPYFSSAPAAFGPDSVDMVMYESSDCYHEREYKVRDAEARAARRLIASARHALDRPASLSAWR